jgi:hypothetical protein
MSWSRRWSAFVSLDRRERELFVASWMLAVPASAVLSLGGFHRATKVLGWVTRHSPPRRDRSGIDVQRAETLVRRAFQTSPARWHVEGGGCLPQSLVQYALQTLAGDPVRLVVGVPPEVPATPSDFEAHAWVEERERRRHDVKHKVIFELPPR